MTCPEKHYRPESEFLQHLSGFTCIVTGAGGLYPATLWIGAIGSAAIIGFGAAATAQWQESQYRKFGIN